MQADNLDIDFVPVSCADVEIILNFFKELFERYEDPADVDEDMAVSWCERKIRKYLDEYFCIQYQGEKAGYIHVHPDGDRVELDDLYLFPRLRGRGIGAAVLRACIREAGSRPVYLYVYSGNVRAVALYQRLGFRVIETVSPTRVIMQRDPLESAETRPIK
ncbi:MAG: GNAT family N-acetyltransferase [Oscillospiraceae bacterium]|nr:GNAT family N-acetyltransferase [Oscillospiraceae bacterium]